VREILATCRRVEERAGDLYRILADSHAHVPAISALWRKTAREEDSHANLVAQSLRKVASNEARVTITAQRAAQILAAIESIIASVRTQPIPVAQALEEAIGLERLMAECHADYAVQFNDPVQHQLFSAMMAADQDHVGSLQAALEDLRRQLGA
jgi:rubrerythrin